MDLALFFIIFAGFYFLGERVCRLWRPVFAGPMEACVFCVALGLVGVSLATTALAFLGLIYPVTGWVALGLIFLVCGKSVVQRLRALIQFCGSFGSRRPAALKPGDWFSVFNLGVVCVLLFMALALAQAPPVRVDSLVYHLAIPKAYLENHGEESPIERLAYCALIFVGENEKVAQEGVNKLLWYMTSNKVAPQFNNPPGYHPPSVAANIMKGTHSSTGLPIVPRLDEQMARGNVFAGTPDQVFQQIKSFWEYSGGFGNLLMMGQAGFMTFEETLKSMKLFTQEVYPRLKELTASYDAGAMKELRASLPDVENVDVSALASEFVR